MTAAANALEGRGADGHTPGRRCQGSRVGEKARGFDPRTPGESRMPLGTQAELPAFLDPGLPLRDRTDDLLRRLTSAEKIAMLHQRSPRGPRLGIAPFRTGTEALHGVAWLGVATVFPQAVGLGAAWDPDLVKAVGTAVGEEVRAIHRRDPAVSLNVWAPVVN